MNSLRNNITIDDVREEFNQDYNNPNCSLIMKIELKSWLNHSESRTKNNNHPFSFDNYTNHMRIVDYIDQVELGVIDCSDLGGKETVLNYLRSER